MPIYEYVCPREHTTTRFQSFSEATETMKCEHCNLRATRVISAPAPPVMGGMVYRPDPHKPLASRAEVKVPLKDIVARDNRLRERMLKLSGKKVTPPPE